MICAQGPPQQPLRNQTAPELDFSSAESSHPGSLSRVQTGTGPPAVRPIKPSGEQTVETGA